MKQCHSCGVVKELTEFSKDKSRKDGHNYNCKDCVKSRELNRLYGIDLNVYNSMFIAQEGKCAICGTHQCQTKKAFAVDHCHSTGKVRGLLCSNCNTALGKFNDNIELLKNAINYLRPPEG